MGRARSRGWVGVLRQSSHVACSDTIDPATVNRESCGIFYTRIQTGLLHRTGLDANFNAC